MSHLNALHNSLAPEIARCNARERMAARRSLPLHARFQLALFWREPWKISLMKNGPHGPHHGHETLILSRERFPDSAAHHTDSLVMSVQEGQAYVSRYNSGWTQGGAVWVGTPNASPVKTENLLNIAKGWIVDTRRLDHQPHVRRPAWHREKLGLTLFDEVAFRL